MGKAEILKDCPFCGLKPTFNRREYATEQYVYCDPCNFRLRLSRWNNRLESLSDESAIERFNVWWETDGQFIDPDSVDVPWFDKRMELALHAFLKGISALQNAREEEREKTLADVDREIEKINRELSGRKHWNRYWKFNGDYIRKRILALSKKGAKECHPNVPKENCKMGCHHEGPICPA